MGSQDGIDISFKKVDYQWNPLPGATFGLFTDADCETPYTKNSTPVTGVSADGVNDKDSRGTVIDEGVVLFEKIPSDVYYLKETTAPTGAAINESVFVLLLGKQKLEVPADSAKTGTLWEPGGILEKITQEDIDVQRGKKADGSFEREYAIFRIENDQATNLADVASNGIMNYSAKSRKAILRKVDDAYTSLSGAQFKLYRADMSEITEGQPEGKDYYESYASGVFFIGKLPYGTYYLHETTIPSGHQKVTEGDDGNWFILTVNETGVGYETEDLKVINTLSPETTAPD